MLWVLVTDSLRALTIASVFLIAVIWLLFGQRPPTAGV